MDFHDALKTVTAELTPQPWDYTDAAGRTLTVIPAGLRADRGRAEVIIRVTESESLPVEIGVTTAELPGMIDALTGCQDWRHQTTLDSIIAALIVPSGDVFLFVTEADWSRNDERRLASASVRVPDDQRLPLASALRRALDVARGWEA